MGPSKNQLCGNPVSLQINSFRLMEKTKVLYLGNGARFFFHTTEAGLSILKKLV